MRVLQCFQDVFVLRAISFQDEMQVSDATSCNYYFLITYSLREQLFYSLS